MSTAVKEEQEANVVGYEDVIVPRAIGREWRKSIREGMRFLDGYYGRKDWVNDVDLETLDLNDGMSCVAGQLFETECEAANNGVANGYEWAVKYVVEHEPWAKDFSQNDEEPAKKLGFYLPTEVDMDDENYQFDDPIEVRIAKRNNTTVDSLHYVNADHWGLFTREWERAIIKRREELAA